MWDKSTKTELGQLVDIVNNYDAGIYTIKPRIILKRVEAMYQAPVQLSMFMPSSDIGSITLLEGAMLAAIARLIHPNIIFEFGTYLGYTTTILVKNTSKECKVTSIDLGDVSDRFSSAAEYSLEELLVDDKKNDDYLRFNQSKRGEYYINSLTEVESRRLNLLKMDSKLLDINQAKLNSVVDMVFIDGGHDDSTIDSDTTNAIKMIGNSGVVIWHDFNSSVHHDVTDYLMNFAKGNIVFHIESTMLAFYIKGDVLTEFLGIAFD
jgi:predicted O-methyltransferase YrrM